MLQLSGALLGEGRPDWICAREQRRRTRSPCPVRSPSGEGSAAPATFSPAPSFSQGFAQLCLRVALITFGRQQRCFKLRIGVHRKGCSSRQAHCHDNRRFPPSQKGAAGGEAMRAVCPEGFSPAEGRIFGSRSGRPWEQQERHVPQGALLGQDVSSLPQIQRKDWDGRSLGGSDIST